MQPLRIDLHSAEAREMIVLASVQAAPADAVKGLPLVLEPGEAPRPTPGVALASYSVKGRKHLITIEVWGREDGTTLVTLKLSAVSSFPQPNARAKGLTAVTRWLERLSAEYALIGGSVHVSFVLPGRCAALDEVTLPPQWPEGLRFVGMRVRFPVAAASAIVQAVGQTNEATAVSVSLGSLRSLAPTELRRRLRVAKRIAGLAQQGRWATAIQVLREDAQA